MSPFTKTKKFGFYSPYLSTFGGGERYMLTLASHLSQNHRVDVFWDDADVKAPLSRFLKIDLSKVAFVDNIFKYPLIKRFKKSIAYSCIFVISDGSVPAVLAPKSIMHFQVPFKFQKQDAKTKLKL